MKRDKSEVLAAVVFLLVVFVIAPALWLGGGNVGATIKEAIRLIATLGICAFFYVIAGLFFRITMRQNPAMEQDLFKTFEGLIFALMAIVIVTAYAPGRDVCVAMKETIGFIAIIGIIVIFLAGFCVILDLLYGDQVRASSRKNGR
jgi:hypothetical protein